MDNDLLQNLKVVKPVCNNPDEHELLKAKKEILRLKSQLKQTEEERDILKATRYFAGLHELSKFILEYSHQFKIKRCAGFLRSLVMAITPSYMNLNQVGLLKISGYTAHPFFL